MSVARKYPLTKQELEYFAEYCRESTIKAYKREQEKTARKNAACTDKVKRTKQILSAYRRLKVTLDEEVRFTEEEEIELRWKFIEDLMGSDDFCKPEKIVNDFEKKRQEDLYSIRQVEKAARLFKRECERAGAESERRYRELEAMYLSEEPHTVAQIAEMENIAEKTVYKDLGICYIAMSQFMLGA